MEFKPQSNHGNPEDFEHKISISELYWLFRWLGDSPRWTQNEESASRFERLHTLGNELGLI